MTGLIKTRTAHSLADDWLNRYRQKKPGFLCVLGFTRTALVPGISAAGNSPQDRQYTAVADAEFLFDGPTPSPHYALPPLQAGVSPAVIARAILATQAIPIYILNTGLPYAPFIPHIDFKGQVANCLSTGQALPIATVYKLFETGLRWGSCLGAKFSNSYLIIGECVVGGTTTAQAVLTALGRQVVGKINSSHATCNHSQKQLLIEKGLANWQPPINVPNQQTVFDAIATVGDPMQPAVAGLALAASCHCGVLLAGGSQMLAVYDLLRVIGNTQPVAHNLNNILVGTTRWVIEDNSSDTIGLAQALDCVPLISSQLSFQESRHPQLQIFEQGFVKEGVGAGGCAIAAHLYQQWTQAELLKEIEALIDSYTISSLQ